MFEALDEIHRICGVIKFEDVFINAVSRSRLLIDNDLLFVLLATILFKRSF